MSRAIDGHALEPLRNALLNRARHEADAVEATMRSRAASELDAAIAAAAQATERARLQGLAEAARTLAADDAACRRQARTMLLAARRSVYDELRARTHDEVARLRDEPVYRELHDAMANAGRSTIGLNATVRDVDDGCTIELHAR